MSTLRRVQVLAFPMRNYSEVDGVYEAPVFPMAELVEPRTRCREAALPVRPGGTGNGHARSSELSAKHLLH